MVELHLKSNLQTLIHACNIGVFVNAGRLKRDAVVSNTKGATEINRMGGRIIRSNERTGTGGSIVVSNGSDMNMHEILDDYFIYLIL